MCVDGEQRKYKERMKAEQREGRWCGKVGEIYKEKNW
jgi:hypothetical protein